MAEQFAIVPAVSSVTLDASRTATVSFTVFNASGQPVNGQALLVSVAGPGQPWLTLFGEAQQTFAVSGAQQYTVQVTVPPIAPVGIYSFRLDMIDTARPGEGYVMGPTVTVIATETRQASTKAEPAKMAPAVRWLAAFGAALIVVGIGVFVMWRGAEKKSEAVATSATAEVIAATVQAAQLETSVAQTVIAQGGIVAQPEQPEGGDAAPTATEAGQAVEPTAAEAEQDAEPTVTQPLPTTAPTLTLAPTEEPSPTTAPPTGAPSATTAPSQTPLPTYTTVPSNTPEPTATATNVPTHTSLPTNTTVPSRTPTPTKTTPPLGYRMTDFTGTWENIDEATTNMTKVIIAKVNESVVSVNGFGKCTPDDCDWGVVNTAFTPYQIVVTQDVGFKQRIMSMERSGSNLIVEVFNDYPPTDTRDDYTYYATMKRDLTIMPLAPVEVLPGLVKTQLPGIVVTLAP